MKIIRVTYCALAAFSFIASCSKEAMEPDVFDWADGKIYFKTSLPDVCTTRGRDMTLDRLEAFQVTCFNSTDLIKNASGVVLPYFENATFVKKSTALAGTAYVSSPAEGPRDWPEKDGLIRFFAFSPSLAKMAAGNSALEGADRNAYFNLINSTTESQSALSVSYRLGKVRINPDISQQFDFITAEAAGTRVHDFLGGVDLAFGHQFSQIELKAWGTGTELNFDIAGVRVGNPEVEGIYVFADDAVPVNVGHWIKPDGSATDKVEYLYRSSADAGAGNGVADRIFSISSREHSTQESAASIMGQGGCAMVIPTVNGKWEGLSDPNIGNAPYHTERMYFSILMRVTDAKTGNQVFPYPGNKNGMAMVSYAVGSNGSITARLYAGPSQGSYFTDAALQHPYAAAAGEEVMDFAWAAVPVDANWDAGKKYVYTLNYSEGIGIHDPADPEPGKPIEGQASIEWVVNVSDWDYAKSGEDFNPDLNVP